MLTVDLVRARRQGGELRLQRFDAATCRRALALADSYLTVAKAHVGRSRGELDEAMAAVPVEPRDRRLAAGILKLVGDRCHFEAEERVDPRELRRLLFARAAEARRALDDGQWLARDEVVGEAATTFGLEPGELDAMLYADLKEQHVLRRLDALSPEALVESYPTAEAQAVLLRAVRLVALVRCDSAHAYRVLFHKLKFRRLLHRAERLEEGGYRIEIDGPMSLFDSVTKYGLALALVLPAIQACSEWSIEASLLWGRDRRPMVLRLAGAGGGDDATGDRLPDEVAALVERFRDARTGWTVEPAAEILELPGIGACVPDLRFVHELSGEVAYLEVLGFWSRDAVWRRVELVRAGMPHRVLFAVPKRLRVSEEVLDDDLPGALYVYRGTMAASAVAAGLDSLLGADPGRGGRRRRRSSRAAGRS